MYAKKKWLKKWSLFFVVLMTITCLMPAVEAYGDVTEAEVSMAVVGSDGGILFAPSSFSVDDGNEWGLTVLGALDASGVAYTTGYWEAWGYYVESIAGLANEGSSGWMYAVNGVPAMELPGSSSINDGDQIIWYYSSGMGQEPPLWSDLTEDEVDKSVLISALGNAQTRYNAAVEGTSPGQYAAGSKATYQAAINAAKAVKDDADATQVEIDAQVTALASATSTFNAARISAGIADCAVEFLHQKYLAQGMVNNDNGVGAYALYILTQAGADLSTWEYDGEKYGDAVIAAASGDISGPPASAKKLTQDLAAMQALEESGLAGQLVQILQDRQTENGFDNNLFYDIPAFDLLGWIGLIGEIDAGQAKTCILGQMNTTDEDDDYSWGFTYGEPAVYYADFITTAKAVRALNYLDPGQTDPQIQDAITNALNWMEDQQLPDGSFVPAGGYPGMDDPLVNTAEAIGTLSELDMDPYQWTSSENKTAVEYLINQGMKEDGSFGSYGNVMDAVGFLYAYNLLDTVLYLDPARGAMNTGGQKEFKAMLKGSGGVIDITGDAEWSVADGSIAQVSNGVVSALQVGQTVVQAVYQAVYHEFLASAALKVNSSGSQDPGNNNPPAADAKTVTVSMAVVGKSGALLYSPSSFTVDKDNQWGLTVLGALDASGVEYRTALWEWGDVIDSICGMDSDGSGGWMYAVNGRAGTEMAGTCVIKSGDKIIFYWASTMEDQPPLWSDLEKLQTSTPGVPGVITEGLKGLKDSDLESALKNIASAGQVVLVIDNSLSAVGITKDQLAKIRDTGKPLAITIQGVQFVLSPESLKGPEITAGKASQLVFAVEKLSDWAIQNQITPFTGKLKLASDIYELNMVVENEDKTQQKIQQLSGCSIVLAVPEGFLEAAQAGTVAAYWYNEDEKSWEYMGGTYDAESHKVSFEIQHFSKYALLTATGSFEDIMGHWAQKEIEFMAANGFVSGVGEELFSPDTKITRAEFVAILTRMAGLTVKTEEVTAFSDVPDDAWYRNAVDIAVSNGIVKGIGENRFDPQGLITREQMATMVQNLMVQKGLNTELSDMDANKLLNGFTDKEAISSWARSSVASMVQAELMKGRENDKFASQGDSTRAEATVVLYRVFQKLL